MKAAIRYQSRNGNTRAAAQVIGETLGIEARPVGESLDGYVDILFVGGGVYMGDADSALKEFLASLDRNKIGQIAAFSTTGTMDTAIRKICRYSREAGIPVKPNTLCLRMAAQGHALFGEGGKLNERQKKKIREFAADAISEM